MLASPDFQISLKAAAAACSFLVFSADGSQYLGAENSAPSNFGMLEYSGDLTNCSQTGLRQ